MKATITVGITTLEGLEINDDNPRIEGLTIVSDRREGYERIIRYTDDKTGDPVQVRIDYE